MMNNRHLYILCAVLFFAGAGFFIYKVAYLGFPLLPGQKTDVWEVEVKINFNATGRPVKALLYVPRTSADFSIINENFISRGYGISISTQEGNRQVAWSIRNAKGQQTLYYRAMIEKMVTGEQSPAVTRNARIIPSGYEGADLEAATAILLEAKQKSADRITLVMQLLDIMDHQDINDNVKLLVGESPSQQKKIEAIIRILSLDEIPARMAHGLHMTEQYGKSSPATWLEVHVDDKWVGIDPVTRETGKLGNYLTLWKGTDRMVNLAGGENLNVAINIKQSNLESITAASTRERTVHPDFWRYSLLNLPLDTQRVYSILLTVPVGVFLLVLLRNIIGVKTFGTFMPILIAISFRETQLVTGLVLFTVLISAGLAIRFYLEKLKLLLVPRLASVLIIVIMLMLLVSILGHNLGFESGLSVALFPMVIITMTIERMSIVWEERGATEAINQGIGSMVTAAVAFLIMSLDQVEHMVTVFPEVLFILLSLTMLLGRYSGYRLLELHRFKALVSK
jgi:hypothetical protein